MLSKCACVVHPTRVWLNKQQSTRRLALQAASIHLTWIYAHAEPIQHLLCWPNRVREHHILQCKGALQCAAVWHKVTRW
jgi:hypothetical protein